MQWSSARGFRRTLLSFTSTLDREGRNTACRVDTRASLHQRTNWKRNNCIRHAGFVPLMRRIGVINPIHYRATLSLLLFAFFTWSALIRVRVTVYAHAQYFARCWRERDRRGSFKTTKKATEQERLTFLQGHGSTESEKLGQNYDVQGIK